MDYPIPSSLPEMIALGQVPVDEAVIAIAIVGVVQISRAQGKSLEEVTAEVMADDHHLSFTQRHWLSNLVMQTWERIALPCVAS